MVTPQVGFVLPVTPHGWMLTPQVTLPTSTIEGVRPSVRLPCQRDNCSRSALIAFILHTHLL